jgi:3-oxoacyl-[acyl-carrier protein] reductase
VADYFLELAKNPLARSIVSKLPLPVTLPPVLKRRNATWTNEEFSGRTVLLLPDGPAETAGDQAGRFAQALTETVHRLSGKVLQHLPADEQANALLVDATRLSSPLALERVFLALQKNLKLLRSGGRVVIAAAAGDAAAPEAAATMAALKAFVKSVGRELGRSGGTANLLLFPHGAEGEAAEVAAWMLTDRPAFISGQTLELNHADGLEIVRDALLKDKTAIVTGAARGIGLAICQALRREGAQVLGIDHPSQKAVLQDAMQAISADALIQDLSDPLAPAKLAQLIDSGEAGSFGQDGTVDVIVHNAGITRDRTLKRMSVAEWDAVMKLNYEFPRQMSHGMLRPQQGKKPLLAKGGRIIMISSIVGLAGNFGQTNYAAAKGGVIGLTEGLAHAHPDYRINAIACGFIETGMTAKIPPLMREVARRINALKQGGLPEDVAEACLMLAGPHGSQISGQVVRVCGLHPAGA